MNTLVQRFLAAAPATARNAPARQDALRSPERVRETRISLWIPVGARANPRHRSETKQMRDKKLRKTVTDETSTDIAPVCSMKRELVVVG